MLKLKVALFCLNQTKAVKVLKVYLLQKGKYAMPANNMHRATYLANHFFLTVYH